MCWCRADAVDGLWEGRGREREGGERGKRIGGEGRGWEGSGEDGKRVEV